MVLYREALDRLCVRLNMYLVFLPKLSILRCALPMTEKTWLSHAVQYAPASLLLHCRLLTVDYLTCVISSEKFSDVIDEEITFTRLISFSFDFKHWVCIDCAASVSDVVCRCCQIVCFSVPADYCTTSTSHWGLRSCSFSRHAVPSHTATDVQNDDTSTWPCWTSNIGDVAAAACLFVHKFSSRSVRCWSSAVMLPKGLSTPGNKVAVNGNKV